jgi:hypothetical protein
LAGLGFGGKHLAASAKNLIELTKRMKTQEADSIILIDVHTGLGPSGEWLEVQLAFTLAG